MKRFLLIPFAAFVIFQAAPVFAGPLEDQLYSAIDGDNLVAVKALLSQGANPNFEYRFEGGITGHTDGSVWYETALVSAVTQFSPTLKNRFAIVQALVGAGADVNKPTPIHSDSRSRNGSGELEAPQSWNYVPVMGAANNGYTDVLDYLLSKGADPSAIQQGLCPVTALWLAAYTGQTQAVTALVKAKVDINFRGGCLNETPLGIAKRYQRDDAVRVLVDAGAHE